METCFCCCQREGDPSSRSRQVVLGRWRVRIRICIACRVIEFVWIRRDYKSNGYVKTIGFGSYIETTDQNANRVSWLNYSLLSSLSYFCLQSLILFVFLLVYSYVISFTFNLVCLPFRLFCLLFVVYFHQFQAFSTASIDIFAFTFSLLIFLSSLLFESFLCSFFTIFFIETVKFQSNLI